MKLLDSFTTMLRVSAGKYKNIFLDVADKVSRPLTERVRLAMFSILDQYLDKARILDLFAGSGVTGIEALSRGADSCTFVDSSFDAIRVIQDNIKKINSKSHIDIIHNTFEKYVKNCHEQFDIIFLDPPFHSTAKIDIDSLFPVCNDNSIIVLRTSTSIIKRQRHRILDSKFDLVYSKKYSQSEVVFYRPKL